MKVVITYPGLPDAKTIHDEGCWTTKPTKSRPYTGTRPATSREIRNNPKCKRCKP
jgi:hypothetical protein